jgi:hypothetical protein
LFGYFCSVDRRNPQIPSWNCYRQRITLRQTGAITIRNSIPPLARTTLRAIAPDVAATLRQRESDRQHAQQEQASGEINPATSLRLKTRIYKLEGVEKAARGLENIDDEEDLDANCIICFQALADGDRVGALTCDHTFHVDCLKSWLKRRNVCPLCQCPDAAAPQFDEIPPEENAAPEEAPSGTQGQLQE